MILLITNLLSGYVCMYAWYIYQCYGFFQWLGIDGPRSIFFFGNVCSFVRSKRVLLFIRNRTHEFGRVYGCFEDHAPIIVLSDSDLFDEIFVKHFSKFHSRRQFPLEDGSMRQGIRLFSATARNVRFALVSSHQHASQPTPAR